MKIALEDLRNVMIPFHVETNASGMHFLQSLELNSWVQLNLLPLINLTKSCSLEPTYSGIHDPYRGDEDARPDHPGKTISAQPAQFRDLIATYALISDDPDAWVRGTHAFAVHHATPFRYLSPHMKDRVHRFSGAILRRRRIVRKAHGCQCPSQADRYAPRAKRAALHYSLLHHIEDVSDWWELHMAMWGCNEHGNCGMLIQVRVGILHYFISAIFCVLPSTAHVSSAHEGDALKLYMKRQVYLRAFLIIRNDS